MRRTVELSVLLLLVSIVLEVSAGPEFSAKDVALVEKNEEGYYQFMYKEVAWYALDDPATERVYFYNTQSKEVQWQDPRMKEPNPPGRPIVIGVPDKPTESKTQEPPTWTLLTIVLVPVFTFTFFMFGRIAYLQIYYPELLWPSKERKQRYKNNNKFKPQKARGKMSQDGKGGRSANS